MTNETRLAARVTAQQITITALQDELAAQRAHADQLDATIAELRFHTLNAIREARRLEQIHRHRSQLLHRLRSRLYDARRSRDLWRHRALRRTT
jgi:hypothetical protein